MAMNKGLANYLAAKKAAASTTPVQGVQGVQPQKVKGKKHAKVLHKTVTPQSTTQKTFPKF